MFAVFRKRPRNLNVLIILVDQLRNDMRGCHPIFDRIGRMGTLFSGMVTYAPYTLASIPAILTGVYGQKNGVNAYYKALDFKGSECGTLQEYFLGMGFYTRADTFRRLLIPEKGFEKVLIYDENNTDVSNRHRQILRDLNKLDKNYFAFLHHGMIHRNMVKDVIGKFGEFDEEYFGNIVKNTARYESYVREAGEYLESIFDLVETLRLYERNLIVVCTDHGCSLGERPGERCYGVYTYDYSIRTWAYFMQKALVPHGIEITDQVRTIDIAPTILDVLKISPWKKYIPMQGRSLLDYMIGKERGGREAFAETGGLEGPWPSPYEPNVRCVRTGEWKVIYNSTTGAAELYNIGKDAGETENLAEKYPDVVERLMTKLESYS
ncbi:MAG: sulfatase [Candidatus Methylomirabilales bacterium]